MEKIQPEKYVELSYEILVKGADGGETSVYKFSKAHPDAFVFGQDPAMIEGFMAHINGLEQGAAFDFTLAPEQAFGPKDPGMVVELDKEIFTADGEFDSEHVKPGAMVPMRTADGYRMDGKVLSVGDDKVTLDFNHQLAGETIRYVGEVLTVRQATDEELHPQPRGCGGNKGGCGGGCGGNKGGCGEDGCCGGCD